MENNERTRTRQDAQELTAQLSKLRTLDTETQQEVIECIEAFLTSRSIDAALREVWEEAADAKAQLTQASQACIEMQQIIDGLRSERARHNVLILSQRDQLQAQSVCYQDNLTEIQWLKAKLANEIANVKAHISTNTRLDHLVIKLRAQLDTEVRKHHGTIDAANSAQTYIENLESHIRDKCEIYPGLCLHTREDGIWLSFDGGGATGKKGSVHLGNHFAGDRVVGPAVTEWLQRMKRWEEGTS
jgi:hypothetical protein